MGEQRQIISHGTAVPQLHASHRLSFRGGIFESAWIAADSLRSNKLRTFLTMLGVIIGVWSVVTLIALGSGAQYTIATQMRSIGTNLLMVLPGVRARNNPRQYAGIPPALTNDDAQLIERALPEIGYVAPEYQKDAQIVAGSLNRNSRILGVSADYAVVRNMKMLDGQFLSDQDVRSGRLVTVLGRRLAEDFFGQNDPIGQYIRIKGQAFAVIGILEIGGVIGGYDSAALIPITTAQQRLFGGLDAASSSFQLSTLLLQVNDQDDINLVQADVEQLLRRHRRLPPDGSGDDFTVINQASLLATVNTISRTLTILLGAIASISLLVGGIGVMNIMLVSVTERTREIGLRKALGAKRRDILRQFLVEALTMSLIGGLIGVALGYLTVEVMGRLFAEYITPVMTPAAIFLAVGVSLAVGLFFGIYPARRAARLRPIEALRFE